MNFKTSKQPLLPTSVILTGINQSDHYGQFDNLSLKIENSLPSHTAILPARHCSNIKSAVQKMVGCFIDNDLNTEEQSIRQNQYTMQVLRSWFFEKEGHQKSCLVVIIPDFELFNQTVLLDLISILTTYRSELPLILILGVATSVSALINLIPYHITSKLKFEVLKTLQSTTLLNSIINDVLLSPFCPFRLSRNVLTHLVDVFMYYDFSINSFIKGLNYCMLEHFLRGDLYSLCCDFKNYKTYPDLKAVLNLPNFRKKIENSDPVDAVLLLTNQSFVRKTLKESITEVHIYYANLHSGLLVFHSFVHDLPKNPMGKQFREVYSNAIWKNILNLEQFNESWILLSLLSKSEILEKLEVSTTKLDSYKKSVEEHPHLNSCLPIIIEIIKKLNEFKTTIQLAGLEVSANTQAQVPIPKSLNRLELKEHLLEMNKQPKPISEFRKQVNSCLEYIKDEIITKLILPFSSGPDFLKYFVFSEFLTIKHHIIGAPRGAIHTAMNNPHKYLQCKCCKLENSLATIPTLPDISIVYKWHLECGAMINLFDWLQGFRSVVDLSDEEQDNIDPKIL